MLIKLSKKLIINVTHEKNNLRKLVNIQIQCEKDLSEQFYQYLLLVFINYKILSVLEVSKIQIYYFL